MITDPTTTPRHPLEDQLDERREHLVEVENNLKMVGDQVEAAAAVQGQLRAELHDVERRIVELAVPIDFRLGTGAVTLSGSREDRARVLHQRRVEILEADAEAFRCIGNLEQRRAQIRRYRSSVVDQVNQLESDLERALATGEEAPPPETWRSKLSALTQRALGA